LEGIKEFHAPSLKEVVADKHGVLYLRGEIGFTLPIAEGEKGGRGPAEGEEGEEGGSSLTPTTRQLDPLF